MLTLTHHYVRSSFTHTIVSGAAGVGTADTLDVLITGDAPVSARRVA